MENNLQKRSPAMDIIRCFALFMVVYSHFFLNSGYFDTPMTCPRMYIMGFLHSISIICVPLFIILSGYLMKNKTLSKKYYSKIWYTLGIYVLASIACAAYKFIINPENFSIFGGIMGIFDFTTANYSWYVEMYLGLFLLIPFLNLIYNGLTSQKQKLWLIATMLILTAVPSVLNSYQLLNPSWWLRPSSNTNIDIIFPNWWIGIYPITYYYIGCYLKDHPLKIKPIKHFLIIIATVFAFGLYNCYRSFGANPIIAEWNMPESLYNVIQCVLIFSFLSNLKYSKIGEKGGKFLAYLSKLTLGAYLCSWIFDDIFYGILRNIQPDMHLRLNYFPLIVPAVYICSLALSALLNFAYDIIAKMVISIRNKSNKTA